MDPGILAFTTRMIEKHEKLDKSVGMRSEYIPTHGDAAREDKP